MEVLQFAVMYNITMSFEKLILEKMTSMEHHIAILNDEFGEVCSRMAVLESQMADIQWMGRLVLGSILLSLIASVLSLVWVKKNNK